MWLALELIKKIGLGELFESIMPQTHPKISRAVLAHVLIVSRFCEPSSELIVPNSSTARVRFPIFREFPARTFTIIGSTAHWIHCWNTKTTSRNISKNAWASSFRLPMTFSCTMSLPVTFKERHIEEIKNLTLVDFVLLTSTGTEIKLRCVSEPDRQLALLLQKLNLRPPQRMEMKLNL